MNYICGKYVFATEAECIDRWFVTFMGNTWTFETGQEADEKVEECKENLRKRGWLK